MMHDAVFLGDFDPLQPFRKPFRHVFLEKSLFGDAGRKAFHGDGTANDMRQHDGRNHLVISGKVAFCNPVIREQDLFGMGDHHVSLTTSRGDLSWRMPTSREWRSLPCTVHSMKATCTTISGRTQCARVRGRPLKSGLCPEPRLGRLRGPTTPRRSLAGAPCAPWPTFVNGVLGVAGASSRARRAR